MKKFFISTLFVASLFANTYNFFNAYTQITEDSILAYNCVQELKEKGQIQGSCEAFNKRINTVNYNALVQLNINDFDFSDFKVLERDDIDKNATKEALFDIFMQKAKANLELNNLLNTISATTSNY